MISVGGSSAGGAVMLGRNPYGFPRLTRLSWYSDPDTGTVLALLLTPDGVLHIVAEDGEVTGLPPAALQMFIKQNFT